MRWVKFIAASAVFIGLSLGASAAVAAIEVVNAGDEYSAAHPHPKAVRRASASDFHATMDQVFGEGRWRQTSGFRTQAQENALRRQGAGTVAPGRISYHSVGGPEAPGAYDAVVARMSAASAAAKLKQAGVPFHRVLAERAHGRQGSHLHVELVSAAGAAGEN
jgi:hypothetical protein